MDSIFHRVSIRKYEARDIEPEKIEKMMRAAMAAPSACNQQPWEFYVVTKKELIQALSQASPYAGCLASAPVAMIPCYRENCIVPEYAQIDLSIATEHILLEADTLGLGAVWLGIAPIEERMKKVEDLLGLQPGIRAFAIVAIGYPAETKEQEERYQEERIHYIQ